jgi:hypothetical protein
MRAATDHITPDRLAAVLDLAALSEALNQSWRS